jgi:hypothetical protein
MDVEVTVSNYRCFSDTPVRFALKKGLQAFVGVNNSGKSCLLRLFYELRNVLSALSQQNGVWSALQGRQGYNLMSLVKDRDEIFCDRNERDLVLGFDMTPESVEGAPAPSRVEIVGHRGTGQWSVKIYAGGSPVPTGGVTLGMQGNHYVVYQPTGTPIVSLKPVAELGSILSRMLYLGPFRNAVNIGGSGITTTYKLASRS